MAGNDPIDAPDEARPVFIISSPFASWILFKLDPEGPRRSALSGSVSSIDQGSDPLGPADVDHKIWWV
jgi:hypothetical protein